MNKNNLLNQAYLFDKKFKETGDFPEVEDFGVVYVFSKMDFGYETYQNAIEESKIKGVYNEIALSKELEALLKFDDISLIKFLKLIYDNLISSLQASYFDFFPQKSHKYLNTYFNIACRIYVEKIYYDLFHKEKAFRWDLLKYLQKDGETVILPEISGKKITTKA